MLAEILNQIELSLTENFGEVFSSLKPGATEFELSLLQKRCLGGRELPTDLAALYRWHNGQDGFLSLNREDNRTFLPIEDVINAWDFLNDPMEDILEPISKEWIPFAYNGAGDYLMYDLVNGKILGYWHDDEDRSVESSSLTEWLLEVLDAAKR